MKLAVRERDGRTLDGEDRSGIMRREGKGKPAAGPTREVVPDPHPAVESISWEQDEIEDIHLELPKSD